MLIDPFPDFAEYVDEKATVDVRGLGEREVKIFGESVGFEIAFLKAGPALEYPALDESVVVIYAGKDSANYVVFLDNMGPQSKDAGGI